MWNLKVFLSRNEVIFGMNGERRLAVAYYPKTSRTEFVGLSIDDFCRISLDGLPREGYCISTYEPCDYGETFLIFRRGIYTYEESLFLDTENAYDVVFLETGDVLKANIEMVASGCGKNYHLKYVLPEHNENFFDRDAYGSKFVISK